jgi:hypothetical protein
LGDVYITAASIEIVCRVCGAETICRESRTINDAIIPVVAHVIRIPVKQIIRNQTVIQIRPRRKREDSKRTHDNPNSAFHLIPFLLGHVPDSAGTHCGRQPTKRNIRGK